MYAIKIVAVVGKTFEKEGVLEQLPEASSSASMILLWLPVMLGLGSKPLCRPQS